MKALENLTKIIIDNELKKAKVKVDKIFNNKLSYLTEVIRSSYINDDHKEAIFLKEFLTKNEQIIKEILIETELIIATEESRIPSNDKKFLILLNSIECNFNAPCLNEKEERMILSFLLKFAEREMNIASYDFFDRKKFIEYLGETYLSFLKTITPEPIENKSKSSHNNEKLSILLILLICKIPTLIMKRDVNHNSDCQPISNQD